VNLQEGLLSVGREADMGTVMEEVNIGKCEKAVARAVAGHFGNK